MAGGWRLDGGPAVDPSRFKENGRWGTSPKNWDAQDPERIAMNAEAMAVSQQAIDALPPAQRTAVVLRDIEGLESDEVCNVSEVSETNLRVLLHRGRARLRTALEEHLGK